MTFDEWFGLPENISLDDVQYPVAIRAWNAAIESAAAVCETAPDNLQDSTFSGAARAIRALKGTK